MIIIRIMDYVTIVIMELMKIWRMMIMSKTTLATLVNDILDSLGYKMLKIEFNNS